MFSNLRLIIASLAVLLLTVQSGFTRPKLTQEQAKTCQDAMQEHKKLNTSDLRNLLHKNPNEEVESLDFDQLKKLRRLIELDEQVIFKCRLMIHPNLRNKRSANSPYSVNQTHPDTIPDLPIRKPKIVLVKSEQSKLLPLPAQKPK